MEHEVVFAGFGGQGVLTAGMILSEIALGQGYEVTWMPAYGAEMRGGKAYSVVKISDETIANPDAEELDALVALNRQALEFEKALRPGGVLIVNTSIIDRDTPFRDDVAVVRMECDRIANELGSAKAVNMIALGAMMEKTRLFDAPAALAGIEQYFASRGKARFREANEQAFRAGWDAAAQAG